MALPAGITTFTLQFGRSFSFDGTALGAKVTITPSHEIIWSATGDPLVPIALELTAAVGVFNSQALPHTGQSGFVDGAGNEITDFWYKVEHQATVAGKPVGKLTTRFVQAEPGVTTVDLESFPIDGTVGPVGSVVQAPVLSVNGLTGSVVIEAATNSGVAAFVTEDGPTKEALAGTFVSVEGAPTDGDAIVWDDVAGQWVPAAVEGGGTALTVLSEAEGNAGTATTARAISAARLVQQIAQHAAAGPAGEKGDKGDPGEAGAPGPSAVSTDAGNLAKLGTDNLILVDSTIAAVQVVTGNEARPDAPTVFWMNPDSISPIVNLIEGVDVDVNPDAAGPEGPQGPEGPVGPAGPGVPNGGTTGQALVKMSNADQATAWATISGGGGGGGSSRGFGYQKLRSNSAIRMFDANRVDSNEWNTYNRLCYCPVWIGWPGNDFRHWYTRVDTAVTGAVARYGIYDANLDGTPASKLVEAGPHSLPNTPDMAVFSMSAFQVPSPGLYFLAIVLQGTAGAKLARYVSNLAPFGSSPFGEDFNPNNTGPAPAIAYEDGVTGALPATANVSGWSNVGAYVALRVE